MKARLVVEYKGKRYRVTRNGQCYSKRYCSLFKRGVCDDYLYRRDDLPCNFLQSAFANIGVDVCGCFNEIKK